MKNQNPHSSSSTRSERDSGEGRGEASSTQSEADLIEAQANTNAVSRALAVIVLMTLPGIGGHYLDKWFGTQFFVLIGFALGVCIAIIGLLYVSRIADLAAKRSRELRQAGRQSSSGPVTSSLPKSEPKPTSSESEAGER